jgi:Ca2+/Na+ antiporter
VKKKLRKANIIAGALFIYTTVVAIYFLFFLDRENTMEHYLTIGFSYLIIYVLWLVLRKKEQLAQKRKEGTNQNDKI